MNLLVALVFLLRFSYAALYPASPVGRDLTLSLIIIKTELIKKIDKQTDR